MNIEIMRERIEASDRAAQEAARDVRWVNVSYMLFTATGLYLGHYPSCLEAQRAAERHNAELGNAATGTTERG